jgi:hypothetical protein
MKEERTVFLGVNKKLQTYLLAFSSDKSVELVELFRKNFLNLSENKELVELLSLASLDAYCIHPSPSSITNDEQLRLAFEETVQLQQKSVPKFTKTANVLCIGGKTSAINVKLQPAPAADLSVKKIVSVLKLKGSKGDQFMALLRSSIDVNLKTLVAYTFINQLSRGNLSSILEHIRKDFIKDYDVGKVISYAQSKTRSSTTHGKYVQRALSGIRNKLLMQDVSSEIQSITVGWLTKLYQEDRSKIREGSSFFKSLLEVIKGATALRSTASLEESSSEKLSSSFEDDSGDVD